jgi:hypothetical protein
MKPAPGVLEGQQVGIGGIAGLIASSRFEVKGGSR